MIMELSLMKIRQLKLFDKITAIVVNDYYDESELSSIMTEIQFLEPKLGDENKTRAATEQTSYGERRKKRGRGVFLDDVYTDRRFSSILTVSRKLFQNDQIRKEINTIQDQDKDALYWRMWNNLNYDSTLLQCYTNGDYYDYHVDHSIFTSITTLKFTNAYVGGDLMFRYNGEENLYQAEHNSTILFPSVVDHRVDEVKHNPDSNKNYLENNIFKMRWSIAHLISMR